MPRWMMDFGLFYMDPPRHDHLRRLVSRTFTPSRVTRLEPVIRELARGLLRDVAERGRAEIVHDYAAPLATQGLARAADVLPYLGLCLQVGQ